MTPRRNIIWTASAPAALDRRFTILPDKLAKERAALQRRQKKLRLSCTKIQRIPVKVVRMERTLAE